MVSQKRLKQTWTGCLCAPASTKCAAFLLHHGGVPPLEPNAGSAPVLRDERTAATVPDRLFKRDASTWLCSKSRVSSGRLATGPSRRRCRLRAWVSHRNFNWRWVLRELWRRPFGRTRRLRQFRVRSGRRQWLWRPSWRRRNGAGFGRCQPKGQVRGN